MNNKIVYYIAILFALFITVSWYLLIKMRPKQEDIKKQDSQNDIKENFENTENSDVEEKIPELPQKSKKFMMITTFDNASAISNNDLKWYENFLDINSYLLIDNNTNFYFSQNNPIENKKDKIINNAIGADLNKITLRGPTALHFANDFKNNSISEFTILFMMKIFEITQYSTIYEMICNTTSYNENNSSIQYVPHTVSINILKSTDNKVNIDVYYGKTVFTIPDIPIDVIISDNILLLSMSYKNKIIKVNIGNNEYTQAVKESEDISLGSLPVIINKNGNLDMVLYTFAYYKKELSKDEISDFKQYVHYYLTGMDKLDKQRKEYEEELAKQKAKQEKTVLQVEKCINTKSKLPKCELHNYEYIDFELPSKM